MLTLEAGRVSKIVIEDTAHSLSLMSCRPRMINVVNFTKIYGSTTPHTMLTCVFATTRESRAAPTIQDVPVAVLAASIDIPGICVIYR